MSIDIKLNFAQYNCSLPKITMNFSVKKAFVKINNNSNVGFCLRKNETYYMLIPEINTLIQVKCTGVGIRAADLKIMKLIENGIKNTDFDDFTFGYQFENFDSVNYTSFSYREKCELFHEEDVHIPETTFDIVYNNLVVME